MKIAKFSKTDKFDISQHYQYQSTTRAFVKIQDGCNQMCSYCIIPIVRGRQRSLPHKNVLQQINELVSNGYKEIVLTGVNTAAYCDKNKYQFYDLLKDINELSGNFRVRISSLEPFLIQNKHIDLLTNNPNR